MTDTIAKHADDLIVRLDALAEKATPAPWSPATSCSEDDEEYFASGPGHKYDPETEEYDDEGMSSREDAAMADADFIVALVNAYPQIRAELLAAREVCELELRWQRYTLGDEAPPSIQPALAAYRAARGGGGSDQA